MKKTLMCLSISILALISCSKEDEFVSQISDTNKEEIKGKESLTMTIFESERAFFEFYKNSNNQEFFERNQNIDTSLEDENGRELLSPILTSILNEDNEFRIGDSIVKLKDKKFYKFNYKERDRFNTNKDLYLTEFIGNTALNDFETLGNSQPSLATLKLNGIGGSHQNEFYKLTTSNCATGAIEGPSARKLKYVHELVGEYVNFNGMIHAGLHLKVKLEWNPSGNKWRAAGERRNINVNLQGSARIKYNANGAIAHNYNYNINNNYNCAGDQAIFITQYNAPIYPNQFHWDVIGTGVIKHNISGVNNWNDEW